MEYRFFASVSNGIRNILAPYQSNYRPLDETHGNGTMNPHVRATTDSASTLPNGVVGEDDDVVTEARRIQNTPGHELMSTDLLVLNQVSKIYNGKFRAVDNISVGVPRGECFGLLGVNGA